MTAGGVAGGLVDIYSEMILDHNRQPRNFGPLAAASHTAQGHNPLCGDRIAVHLRLAGERIEEIKFEGVGCAISTASASMMTEALRGKSLVEARQLFERFHALLTVGAGPTAPAGAVAPVAPPVPVGTRPADLPAETADEQDLGKLMAFAGVREYPMRVKCATLAWHALAAALGSSPAAASRSAAVSPKDAAGA